MSAQGDGSSSNSASQGADDVRWCVGGETEVEVGGEFSSSVLSSVADAYPDSESDDEVTASRDSCTCVRSSEEEDEGVGEGERELDRGRDTKIVEVCEVGRLFVASKDELVDELRLRDTNGRLSVLPALILTFSPSTTRSALRSASLSSRASRSSSSVSANLRRSVETILFACGRA